MSNISNPNEENPVNVLLGFLVIGVFAMLMLQQCTKTKTKSAAFDSHDAIAECLAYHRNKGSDMKIFSGNRADVKDYGWFVVVSTKNSDYRRCSVRRDGSIFDAN